VDPDSQVITAAGIEAVLSPRTRAIIVVHLAGWPCEMQPIMELARAHDIKVIEDCAQSHGARYHGHPVGGFADAGVFSFCQDKILTTGGEGGMLVTNDPVLWERAWSYKDHGKSHHLMHKPREPGDSGFRWVHESIGTNWRMTEIQAAVGRLQLGKLVAWVDARRTNAAALTRALETVDGLRIPQIPSHIRHSFYKYYAFLRPERLRAGWDRDRIVAEVGAQGVRCFSGSCSEVYLERPFGELGLKPAERLPVARQLGETSLMLEVDPRVTAEQLTRNAAVLRRVLDLAMA
jgi:dTDP-4-amino-4,6-dideoxygalactose transaminase